MNGQQAYERTCHDLRFTAGRLQEGGQPSSRAHDAGISGADAEGGGVFDEALAVAVDPHLADAGVAAATWSGSVAPATEP